MAAPAIPYYIISRYSDPIFAIFIGCSAALLRIRKEEMEKRSGLPSASMVVSPQQRERMEVEEAEARKRVRKSKLEMQRDRVMTGRAAEGEGEDDNGGGWGFEDGWWGSGSRPEVKRVEVGNLEVLRMAWERARWKVDYEWNGRRKDVLRKNGKGAEE